jgi:hypothetical protein
MKGIRGTKRIRRKGQALSGARNNEAGFVMTWVIILMVVASLVIGPFLAFMMTGLQAAHSRDETMLEFYAADSGIEDATYKIQQNYSAATELSDDIFDDDTNIPVVDDVGNPADGTALFPDKGVILIGSELIYYTSKEPDAFIIDTTKGGSRGYGGTEAKEHDSGTAVTTGLPQGVGDTWLYSIADINNRQVDVTIEPLWILEGLEGITQLSDEIGDDDTNIPVDSTDGFPASGVVRIGDELIQYEAIDEENSELLVAPDGRGYDDTTASGHDAVAIVFLQSPLPSLPPELLVVGQVFDTTTKLTAAIDDNDSTIPVQSAASFPDATQADPRVILIGDESILYSGKTATQFTVYNDPGTPGLDGRGYDGTVAADHIAQATVTSGEMTYRIDFSYDNSQGSLNIDRIGTWLSRGFDYIPGSSNVGTTLRLGITAGATIIPVQSTDLFPDATEDNPDDDIIIAIEHEFIRISSVDRVNKQLSVYNDPGTPGLDGRGYNGTVAANHLTVGTPVTVEPQLVPHHGGTALEWSFNPVVDFTNLPRPVPLGGGSPPRDEFPIKRTITFRFSPARQPSGSFPWIRTTNTNLYLSWDTESTAYKITSTATELPNGTHTTLESYIAASKLTSRNTIQVFGDSRAIGNSLMKDTVPDPDHIKDALNSPFESTAKITDIPDGAKIEAAYLYWSAWKNSPDDIGNPETLTPAQLQALKELVDQATFKVGGAFQTQVTADRLQIEQRILSGSPEGWVYSAYKDVTDLLWPEPSKTITINPRATTQSATVTNTSTSSNSVSVKITPLSVPGGTGGRLLVNGSEISGATDYTLAASSSLTISSGTVLGNYAFSVYINDSSWSSSSRRVRVDTPSVTNILLGNYGSSGYNYQRQTYLLPLTTSLSGPQSATVTNTSSPSNSVSVKITPISVPSGTGGLLRVNGIEISGATDYTLAASSSLTISSGTVLGNYAFRVYINDSSWSSSSRRVRVDFPGLSSILLGNYGSSGYTYQRQVDFLPRLTTIQAVPQATITKMSLASAEVDVTDATPNNPADANNNITVDGDTVEAGQMKHYGPFIDTTPHTVAGVANDRQYKATITCTKGIVRVDYGSNSIILGEPGLRTTNGEYTVGYLEGITNDDINDSGSFAGWSLIVIYSNSAEYISEHPEEPVRLLYLYDDFRRVNQSSPPSYPSILSLSSTIGGFLAPENFHGRMTCFVGEGDPGSPYIGDSVKCNGLLLPRSPDGVNPQNDVWNSRSSGLAGVSIDGVDIDTFDVSDCIDDGASSATLEFFTGQDGWALVYIFLSFDTIPTVETGGSQLSIITFSLQGG